MNIAYFTSEIPKGWLCQQGAQRTPPLPPVSALKQLSSVILHSVLKTAMNWSTFWFSRQHPVTQNKCTPGCVIQTAHLHNSYPLFTHTFSLFVGWGFRASQAVSTERLLKLWAPSCYTAMLPKDSHAMRRALCLNRPLSHQPYAGGQGLTKYLHSSLRKLAL